MNVSGRLISPSVIQIFQSYDVRNPRQSREARGHEGNVTSLSIVQMDQTKRLLASVSADRQIRLWKIEEDGQAGELKI